MRLAITKRISDEYEDVNPLYVEMLDRNDIKHVCVGLDDDINEILDTCDGLLVTGGVDVNPKLYGKEVNGAYLMSSTDKVDSIDYRWIKAFNTVNKPIIGICRGLQVINVYFNGSLIQHIDNHSNGRLPVYHNVKLVKDGFIYDAYKEDEIEVNSYHHEVIDKLGDGLKAIAFSDEGYIEAIEGNDIYAAQWHPERDNNDIFIKYIKDKVLM